MTEKPKPQFGPRDKVTYNENGDIATIMTENHDGTRTITQYDEHGHATVSQDLYKNDVVNFTGGYISSIVKYEGGAFVDILGATGKTTLQYGPNGKILSSVHESRIDVGRTILHDRNMWVTTSKTTYHDNGKIATHTTYKQRHDNQNRPPQVQDNVSEDIQRMQIWSQRRHEEDHTTTVDSYIASIEQMDESGKLILSVQLQEQDQVNYHPTGRVASILRMNKDGQPQSMTTYDENGKIQNQTVYQDGKVISSTDYTDGKPTNNVQIGDEEYQNIFERAKTRVEEKISETPDTTLTPPTKERD